MFENKFNILSIDRVIFVSSNEYKSSCTDFAKRSKTKTISNELILHLDGETTINFNGKILNTNKETVRFLPQGKITQYTVKRKKSGNCFDIFFTTDVPIAKEAFTKTFESFDKLEEMFRKIFAIWSNKNDGYYFKCMSMLYELIFILNSTSNLSHSRIQIIEPAVTYINENYKCKDIEIPYLAKICKISETYLKKLFHETFSMSPKRYIVHKRMEYAVELLSTQMYSITEIADKLSYDNIYYFSRAFKKEYGLSPSCYIKNCNSSK